MPFTKHQQNNINEFKFSKWMLSRPMNKRSENYNFVTKEDGNSRFRFPKESNDEMYLLKRTPRPYKYNNEEAER